MTVGMSMVGCQFSVVSGFDVSTFPHYFSNDRSAITAATPAKAIAAQAKS